MQKLYQSATKGTVFGLVLFSMLAAAGCLDFVEDEIDDGASSRVADRDPADGFVEMVVQGSVGDGPTANSSIIVENADGVKIWEGSGSGNAEYQATLLVGPEDFPMSVLTYGGTNLVTGDTPDLVMQSVIVDEGANVANINPYTSMIIESASQQSFGITRSTVDSAMDTVARKLNFGLDRRQLGDPINTPIQPSTVATAIRSGEAFSEMLRRTSVVLAAGGMAISPSAVLSYIAGDITDGVVDGRGPNANARVAATANIVSAQITLETLTNTLTVNGVNAISSINAAIAMVEPNATIMVGDLTATSELLAQTEVAVSSAYELVQSQPLAELVADVQGLPVSVSVSNARQQLPPNPGSLLDPAIEAIKFGSDSDFERVNGRVRNGLDPQNADTVPPVISLLGPATIQLNIGDQYDEHGATATDNEDGNISGRIATDSSSVDTSLAGDYSVTYDVTDNAGNAATQRVRSVVVSAFSVSDTEPPVISLNGANPFNLTVGDSYIEPGATAIDNVDGNVSSQIAIDSSAVSTSNAGDYPVRYNVSDAAGNAAAEVIRTVNVSQPATQDITPPVITLVGANPMQLDVGDSYVEPGASAIDDVDGNITSQITINNSAVDTSTAGDYLVTYDVSDAAGNAAVQVGRIVAVNEPTGSNNRPWENILNEAVGFGGNTIGGRGKPLVTVTNLNNSGAGSLRQALADNPTGSWIRFAPGLSGTINLNSTLYPPSFTTIDGRGANITLNGGSRSSGRDVFRVTSAGSSNIILTHLKITNAFDGMRFGSYSGTDPTIRVRNIWIHHVTFIGPFGDECLDFSPRIQDVTVSNSHFLNASKGILVARIKEPYTYDRYSGVQPLRFTSHHNWFENIEYRAPLARHSMLHSYNNLHEGWKWDAVDARAGNAAEGAGVVVENSIGDAAGSSDPDMAEARDISGEAPGIPLRSVGAHLLKNGARVGERNATAVFDPRSYYSYVAEPASSSLESSIRSTSGWVNVPFPE